MASSFYDFTWSVPSAGYRWANLGVRSSAGQPMRVLVEQGEPGIGHRRRYDPLADAPALFREFAAIPPSEAGVLAFANRWGAIGEADIIIGDTPLVGQSAELFAAWLRSISEMRQAVWIWNRLASETAQEQSELRRRVKWEMDDEGHTSISFDSHPHLPPRRALGDDKFLRVAAVIASDNFGNEELSQYQRGEVSQPARTFLARLVNAALRGRVSPQVVPDERSEQMKRDNKVPVMFSLGFVPSNLYAAVWLQLAQAMSSDKRQRQCPGCGRWFEVKVRAGPDERAVRADKQYCRPACRLRAYRQKQDAVHRLHAEGMKPKEIARELGADMALVKKWLSTKKG